MDAASALVVRYLAAIAVRADGRWQHMGMYGAFAARAVPAERDEVTRKLTPEAIAALKAWSKAKHEFTRQYGTLSDLARKHGITISYARNIICVLNLGGDLGRAPPPPTVTK
jgi:hypothetical protein